MLRVSPGEWQETSPTSPTHAFYHRHPFPNEWIKVRSSRMKYRIENAAENTFPINGCHSINNWIAMRSIVCDFANEVLLNMHLVCIDLFWHKQSAAFIRPTPHPPLRTKHAHRAVTAAFAAIRCSFANESMIVFYQYSTPSWTHPRYAQCHYSWSSEWIQYSIQSTTTTTKYILSLCLTLREIERWTTDKNK